MSSIFPSYKTQLEEQNKANILPIATDIAIDFTTGEPVIINGDFVVVTENEAIKVWCYFALKTAKNRFLMFSRNYGSKFEDELVGKEYISDNKIEELIKYCLLVNQYIKSIDSVNCEFEGSRIILEIELTTIYGKDGVAINV